MDLSITDIRALNQAALELHATHTAAEFPWQLHKTLRMLMSGEITVVDWIDPHGSISLACKLYPENLISKELSILANTLAPSQSPVWLKCADEPGAISDFIAYSDWARRDLHWVYRQSGLMDSMGLDIELTSSLTLRLRDLRRNFGSYLPSERLKLKLLGPHIRQVHRRLAAQGQPAPDGRETWRQTEVTVSEGGKNCLWSKIAREMLATQGILVLNDELPSSVKIWFLAQKLALEHPSEVTLGVQPLTLQRGSKTLNLFLMRKPESQSFWLILEEKETTSESDSLFPGLGITRRESEVLFWVAQGKSNSEIATILGVSVGTIGRHLENAFPKLGMENRYAAGLMVMQALTSKSRHDLSLVNPDSA